VGLTAGGVAASTGAPDVGLAAGDDGGTVRTGELAVPEDVACFSPPQAASNQRAAVNRQAMTKKRRDFSF
jgi:hypothetical protein